MALLREKLADQGAFLFRWRSYFPLVLLVPALAALPQSGALEHVFGEQAEAAWDIFCVALAFVGLAVRIATVGYAPSGTSGRNTTGQRADSLNTSGFYSIVRNPLYLGNIITFFAFILAFKIWWLSLFALPITVMYYERIIMAEESFLAGKFGKAYLNWASQTPAYIPNFRTFKKPDLPFSLKTVLRREYHGFYLIVFALTFIEVLTDVVGDGENALEWLHDDPGWVTFFIGGTVVYVVIRLIRKTTGWLVVPGR